MLEFYPLARIKRFFKDSGDTGDSHELLSPIDALDKFMTKFGPKSQKCWVLLKTTTNTLTDVNLVTHVHVTHAPA